MPKLPVLKSKRLLKILQKAGFKIDHTTGSHYILYHPNGKRVTLPYHLKDLPKGTIQTILKSAGIERKNLDKYL
ncbi:type II toxin-antitoxin system HicA family toxin [Patescibacteria group bacterium]|nr:type II toxin-antitoxin system HicA family toxin [Patescibacteria group bacterium]